MLYLITPNCGGKDEGSVKDPRRLYLQTLGITKPISPELSVKIDALVKAEIARRETAPPTEPQAFIAALKAMPPRERREALKAHYATALKDNKWEDVRSAKPTVKEFRNWLDGVFSDRRKVGLVLADLKYLSPEAYKKVENWMREGSGVSKADIEFLQVAFETNKERQPRTHRDRNRCRGGY